MNLYQDYSVMLFDEFPDDYVILADPHFHLDSYRGDVLEQVYNSTTPIKSFTSLKSNYDVYQYPYSSLGYNYDAGLIEIRSSSDLAD
jgi:hypothetical protein